MVTQQPPLVIFDCDGTLVDSQQPIIRAVEESFEHFHLPQPGAMAIRGIIGLSLAQAIKTLAPQLDRDELAEVGQHFSSVYRRSRTADALYPGIAEMLQELDAAGVLMGVATGNSMRGLTYILESHDLKHHFVSLQTADHHPSKPHPSMIQQCLADAGCGAERTMMVGDTSFDMEMARAAGVFALGVNWGYHDEAHLRTSGAAEIAESADDILRHIKDWRAQHER